MFLRRTASTLASFGSISCIPIDVIRMFRLAYFVPCHQPQHCIAACGAIDCKEVTCGWLPPLGGVAWCTASKTRSRSLDDPVHCQRLRLSVFALYIVDSLRTSNRHLISDRKRAVSRVSNSANGISTPSSQLRSSARGSPFVGHPSLVCQP